MASRDRSRSPSAGLLDTSKAAASPPALLNAASASIADATLHQNTTAQPVYNQSFALDDYQTSNFFPTNNYATFQQLPAQVNDVAGDALLASHGLASSSSNGASSFGYSNGNVQSQNSAFPSYNYDGGLASFDQQSVDLSLLGTVNPNGLNLVGSQPLASDTTTTTTTSLDPMATLHTTSPPPAPHMYGQMGHPQSNSPSPRASPNARQSISAMAATNRQRAVSESLDPSSAMFPQGQNEWSQMTFRGHRHTPSDQYSDISSHSNNASPYLQTLDSFDINGQASPLLDPTQDPSFNDGLGLQDFTLNEHQLQAPHFSPSPGHSPRISPLVGGPQRPLPAFTATDDFGLNPGFEFGGLEQGQNTLEPFPGMGQEAFPALAGHHMGDMGHADAMGTPDINIVHAPPSEHQADNSGQNHNEEALSPPARSRSNARTRAKSDPFTGSRPSSPSYIARGRSPSLQPTINDNLLTVEAIGNTSRSPSPAVRGRSGSAPRGRSSSNSSEQRRSPREVILDLVNPDRAASNGADRRTQRHPATFQCHRCPKRFTRAYNLRSHLRTHTDERPFVCTVCNKAFARQHDRRRHEGLHSGEKRFACRGTLQNGQQWGCGRRFARADALGRHFRSEAGRVCIKPLLEEEAAERQKSLLENPNHHNQNPGMLPPQGHPNHNPLMAQVDMLGMSSFLPAAILQQYPVLAGLDWNSLPQGPPPDEDFGPAGAGASGDMGRSSFEASSGGEMYDELSDAEIEASFAAGQNMMMQGGAMGMQNATAMGAAQGYGVYGTQAGDYLSDFEGR